ncbi:MAG TPA: protein kinase [Longimicrobiaceae bacterium]|nr:protein kinase [Longimicrobiaceae bacterium]
MSGLEGLLAGRVLGGRYLIEEVIGRGGMGAVYRAVDERLGRKVAVKVITVAAPGEPEARERLRARFYREARAAAALPHHPNVVPVYDYGTDEALGIDYLVMELLRGSDLATRLSRSGAPPLATALRILLEAARGLAVGHRAGLIHRDVKPGNVFLTRGDNDEPQVRVVDFGIAKLADEDTLTQLTQDGRAPHSPAFASPEQLRGLGHLTPASDVFSLGAVGYLLLTGERPFSDEDRNKMSLGMPVAAPSPRALNPAIPDAVEAIVEKALAFDPQDRYPDAGAFAASLDQALRDLSGQPLAPYEFGAALPPEPTAPAPVEAREPTQPMDVEDHTLLAPPAPPATAPVGTPPSAPPPRAKPPASVPGRRSAAPFVWAIVILLLAGAAIWAYWMSNHPGRTAQPVVPLDTVAALPPDTLAAAESARIATADAIIANQEGLRLYEANDTLGALAQFQRAVQLAPGQAEYHRNYGIALVDVGQAARGEAELRQALQLSPSLVVAYANLAKAQLAQRDTSGAIASLQRYVQLTTDAAGRDRAQRQLREIRAQQATGGLLGTPLDTTTHQPDTAHIPAPPGGP